MAKQRSEFHLSPTYGGILIDADDALIYSYTINISTIEIQNNGVSLLIGDSRDFQEGKELNLTPRVSHMFKK